MAFATSSCCLKEGSSRLHTLVNQIVVTDLDSMTWPDTQVVLVGGVVGSRLVLAPFAFLARFKQILMVYFTSLDIYLAQTQGSRSF